MVLDDLGLIQFSLHFSYGVSFSGVLVSTEVTVQACVFVLDGIGGSNWPVCHVDLLGEFV